MNTFKQRMTEYDEVIVSKTIPKNFVRMAYKAKAEWTDRIFAFAKESNQIENIYNEDEHIECENKLYDFLCKDELTVSDLCAFNGLHGQLRLTPGQDVMVGGQAPPFGGAKIGYELKNIVEAANLKVSAYTVHIRFETLHPFTDGNGRTGRALWLWQRVNQTEYWIENLFLQQWYYDTLERF